MTDDRSLINAVLSGNPDAFETIINRYKNKVFGMVYALTGDKEVTRDLSQEVFVKIYNNLGQFNPDLSLAGWVYRIARNTAFDYLRRNRHVTHFSFDETIDRTSGDGEDPARIYELKEKVRILNEAVGNLPTELKEIFILKYFEEMSYKEISCQMGLPETTVQNRLFKARLKLKNIFSDTEKGFEKEASV